MTDEVIILMGTYNGAEFIEEQLKSILMQTYKNWKLIIRDDCSTDKTVDIIRRYISKNKNIKLLVGDKNIGQVRNFEELIKLCVGNSYVMFCDQDDVWKVDKIEKTIKAMKRVEENNEGKPVLIYTKKTMVDATLNLICHETIEFKTDLFSILCQNPVYGCTMMINHYLKEKMLPFPDSVTCHDYWAALIASESGIIYLLDYESLYYRQHSANITGGINNYSILQKFRKFKSVNERMKLIIKQNYQFCKNIALGNCEAEKYISILNKPCFLRAVYALHSGYRLHSVLATIRGLLVLTSIKL